MKWERTVALWKKWGCVGRAGAISAIFVIGLVALLLAGAIYEALAAAAVVERFPAPGQLVTVNERTMHISCSGEGSPTIVLDAGQGGWSSDWADIVPELSHNNRVCAYDRAGYGWSAPAADERSPLQTADDLEALLQVAAVEPPYLLVGFSHAGLANRIFAARNAGQMAGLVLVDPATEFDNELLGEALVQQQKSAAGLFQGFGLLARMGILRLLGTENMAGSAPFIAASAPDPDLYYAFVAAPQWWETSTREFMSRLTEEHLAQVRALGALPDIPVVIIASETIEAMGGGDASVLQAARHAALRDLAAQAPRGSFVVAGGSSHNVLADRPDAIQEAVAAILAAP